MPVTAGLIELAQRVFPPEDWQLLNAISASDPLDRAALVEFDDALGGPSVSRITDDRPDAPGTLRIPRHGTTRCHLNDRDIFRPLHYCAVYLTSPEQHVEWQARNVVQLSGAHLEQLVKRIGFLGALPLGNLLRNAVVKRKVDPVTWGHLWSYRLIYNAAKHDFSHPMGTHLFSVRDAVLAYVIARRLGYQLYPIASLETDW